MTDPYVYPGTGTLKNLLGIQDKNRLDDAEADYVSLRLRELAEYPLDGDYSVSHFAKMHKYIFQDIYGWAGEFSTINIEKEEPALVAYCAVFHDLGDLSKKEYLEKIIGDALEYTPPASMPGTT